MCMSGGGGGGFGALAPAAPAAAAPPPPTAVDPSVIAARQNIIAQAALAQGRGATIAAQTGDNGQSPKKELTGQ